MIENAGLGMDGGHEKVVGSAKGGLHGTEELPVIWIRLSVGICEMVVGIRCGTAGYVRILHRQSSPTLLPHQT